MNSDPSSIAFQIQEIRKLVQDGKLASVPGLLRELSKQSNGASEAESKMILDLAIEIATCEAERRQQPG